MPGRVMVLLVCSGVLLSAVGIYQPLVDYAGAGASVPLPGFGHLLWKGMKTAITRMVFSDFLQAASLPVPQVCPLL